MFEDTTFFTDKNDDNATRAKKQVRFIFSHSALREGWDNPNVFVICTLKHSDNVISRRQEVGRGLRLAVNRDGERMDANYFGTLGEVHKLNELTVVTNESYATFVGELQSELAKVLASRPTKATPTYFEGKIVTNEDGKKIEVSTEMALDIYTYLVTNGYADSEKQITPKYHEDKDNGNLAPLPEVLAPFATDIHTLTGAVLNPKDIENMIGNDRTTIRNPINQSNLERKEFQALWAQINKKAVYKIEIDSEKLIKDSVEAIQETALKRNNHFVETLSYLIRTGSQSENLNKSKVESSEGFDKSQSATEKPKISVHSSVEYDLVGDIAESTKLTRKTVVNILQGIDAGTFSQFKNNPEAFIREVAKIINEQSAKMLVQSLTYYPTTEKYLDNDIFVTNDKIPSNAMKAEKHVWDYVVTDSKGEREFAEELESAVDEVIVYAKLPDRFQIPTPFGNYNPDWAIAFNKEKVRHIYFVAEQKGSDQDDQLRDNEKRKIRSAEKFFKTIVSDTQANSVQYGMVSSYEELKKIVGII